jgi:tRNA threonylcarbamoyl adenosine modification protein YeaZ
MKILGLEFSSAQRSAVVDDFRSEQEDSNTRLSEVIQTAGTETRAFGMIDDALRETRLDRRQMECIAIGLGPGSYTGIRIAIAIAQGWQIATQAKTIGIGSADAIVAQAHADGFRGPVHVVIDAQRNELYCAAYEITDRAFRICEPLRIETADLLKKRISTSAVVIGPEAPRWFAHGKQVFPRASMIARLAARTMAFTPAEQLEPIYLRETTFVKASPPSMASGGK